MKKLKLAGISQPQVDPEKNATGRKKKRRVACDGSEKNGCVQHKAAKKKTSSNLHLFVDQIWSRMPSFKGRFTFFIFDLVRL